MTKRTILPLCCLLALGLACAAVIAQQPSSYVVPVQPGNQNYFSTVATFEQGPQPAQIAQKYVKAEKEEEKKDLRKKLMDTLNRQFDQHVEQQQKEVEQLEKQIAELKALLKKRVDAKPSIVDRRFEQLVQDAQGLGWTVPGGQPRTAPNSFTTVAPAGMMPKRE